MDIASGRKATASLLAFESLPPNLRRASRITLLLVAAGVVLLGVRAARPDLLTAIRIERVQLFLFPVFFLALWFAAASASLSARRMLLLAAGIGFATTLYGYLTSALSILTGSADVVLVSRLKGDADDGETRIFRERISHFLRFAEVAVRPEQQTKVFSSDQEVREVLAARRQVEGVVWGSTRFLSISFPERAPIQIVSYGQLQLGALIEGLEIVDSVPAVGLSYEPRESAAFFVTKLLEGMAKPITTTDTHGDETYRKQFAALHIGAEVATLHFGTGHRAYALWRAGTDSLQRYLVTGALEPGYLRCAETDLRVAQKLLRFNENPELAAAILNNLGIVVAIRGDLESDGQALSRARKTFKHANRTRIQLDHFGVAPKAVQTAQRNAARISGKMQHGFKTKPRKVAKIKKRKKRNPDRVKKPKHRKKDGGKKKKKRRAAGATE